MTARLRRAGPAALAVLLAAAVPAGGGPARPSRAAKPTLRAGETLAFRGSWQGLDAAAAALALEPGSRPGTLRVAGRAETSALVASLYAARYRTEIECDAASLLPLTVRRESEENGRRRTEAVEFDRARRTLRAGARTFPLDPAAHDPVTALLALRLRRWGGIGSRVTLPVTDLGTPWELVARVADRRAGRLELALEARAPGAPAPASEMKLVLEEDGARRILSLETALPVGTVRFDLAE